MGLLGIFTAVRAARTHSAIATPRILRVPIVCLAHLDELADAYRNFDFYWYPRRADEVRLRSLNRLCMPDPGCRMAATQREEDLASRDHRVTRS